MTTRVLPAAVVAVVAVLASSPASAGQDAKRGQEVYTAQKCQGCHNIAGKGFKNNTLDGIGGFCSYGLIENTSTARAAAALPIGLSEGCVLRRDIFQC